MYFHYLPIQISIVLYLTFHFNSCRIAFFFSFFVFLLFPFASVLVNTLHEFHFFNSYAKLNLFLLTIIKNRLYLLNGLPFSNDCLINNIFDLTNVTIYISTGCGGAKALSTRAFLLLDESTIFAVKMSCFSFLIFYDPNEWTYCT